MAVVVLLAAAAFSLWPVAVLCQALRFFIVYNNNNTQARRDDDDNDWLYLVSIYIYEACQCNTLGPKL